MALTDEERKRRLDQFREVTKKIDDEIVNDWTEAEMLDAVKRIMQKLGIEEMLYDGRRTENKDG